MLYDDLIIVDLETTGTSASAHRIIEIGLCEIRNGQLVDEWQSLVNPQIRISPFISNYTGITNTMVVTAPTFAAIAPRLFERLQGKLFVAHNARFDYGFLREEFLRLDLDFQLCQLCTVKLSRRLYPAERSHSLDSLIRRHDLPLESRHRALGDAKSVWSFLQLMKEEWPTATLQKAIQSSMKTASGRTFPETSQSTLLP